MQKVSDLCYRIQKQATASSLVFHVYHLKLYEGNKSVKSWLPTGAPAPFVDPLDYYDREDIGMSVGQLFNFWVWGRHLMMGKTTVNRERKNWLWVNAFLVFLCCFVLSSWMQLLSLFGIWFCWLMQWVSHSSYTILVVHWCSLHGESVILYPYTCAHYRGARFKPQNHWKGDTAPPGNRAPSCIPFHCWKTSWWTSTERIQGSVNFQFHLYSIPWEVCHAVVNQPFYIQVERVLWAPDQAVVPTSVSGWIGTHFQTTYICGLSNDILGVFSVFIRFNLD